MVVSHMIISPENIDFDDCWSDTYPLESRDDMVVRIMICPAESRDTNTRVVKSMTVPTESRDSMVTRFM